MPSLPVIALAILVMALGSAVQAAVGIGMALVVVPILALIDTQEKVRLTPELFAELQAALGEKAWNIETAGRSEEHTSELQSQR